MTSPSKYVRGSDFDGAASSAELGAALDAELQAVAQTGAELVAAISDVRRSDGHLRNGIVADANLTPGLVADLAAPILAVAVDASASAGDAAGAAMATTGAVPIAQSASERLAALAAAIARNGWSDYGYVTDPPGPPRNDRDMGTL